MKGTGRRPGNKPSALVHTTVRARACFGDVLPRDLESGSFARYRPSAARGVRGREP